MDHGAADCHPGCLGDPEHDLLSGVGGQLLADLPVADIQAQGWHLLADAELPRLAQVPSTLPPVAGMTRSMRSRAVTGRVIR